MCGQAGIILGQKKRRGDERDHLAWLFTQLLVLNEPRGPHATGVAWLKRDGEHRLFKRPVRATRLVGDKAFHEVLAGIDNRTTLILGHTRWRTVGDEQVNENNHPIRAGDILGTHNGTIYNADYLFRRFRLPRFAEVDSELLCRLAGHAARNGRIDIESFKGHLTFCRGQMTAVMASRRDPETVLVLKGNMPLEMRLNRRHRAVLYASDAAYLDAVLDEEHGWRELTVPTMSLMVFRHRDVTDWSMRPFEFVAQSRRRQKTDLVEAIDDWERMVYRTR